MTSQDLRKKFQSYFLNLDHKPVKSSSLIPAKNSGLIFTNAGMNQFKDVFLNLTPPPYPQVYSIQKCLRAGGKHNDLEQVGFSPFHHTFFEMMGFFSFGSYFKKKAILFAWDFLTTYMGLEKNRLWVSVLKEDDKSYAVWKTIIPTEKIFVLSEKDNFWRMGDTGPCGPCSEIHYYNGSDKNPCLEDMTEIWNLVFMEFNEIYQNNRKIKTPLLKPCVDTGMSLERLATVIQGKNSNYHNSIFKGIIKAIESKSKEKYDFTSMRLEEKQIAFRVIADHSRAVCFLVCDGILPGNEGASYVLRRLLRRAFFYNYKLAENKNLLTVACREVVSSMNSIYPELEREQTLMVSIIEQERTLFMESLKAGEKIFLKKIKSLSSSSKVLPADLVWDLYSTYGFPPDLTDLMAKEKGLAVDKNFNLENFKKDHRSPVKFKKNYLESFIQNFSIKKNISNPLVKTKFTGYEHSKEESHITHLIGSVAIKDVSHFKSQDPFFLSSIKKENEKGFLIEKINEEENSVAHKQLLENTTEGLFWLIAKKTPFYPEGGGAVGDRGFIKTSTGSAQVVDCQKKGDIIFHLIKILEKEIKINQNCIMEVDEKHRKLIASSHSATHLLHQALRQELGSFVRQKGSLVEPGKLRFDFSYSKPLSFQQIEKIETQVIKYIQKGHLTVADICSYETAIQKGALYLAGETYNPKVRTIKMGESLEFCGGIHVKNTSQIGQFKIISETGVQSGVRRITAYTSSLCLSWFKLLEEQNKTLRSYLLMSVPKTAEKENPFIAFLKEQEMKIKSLQKQIQGRIFKKQIKMEKPISKNKTISYLSSKEPYFLVRQNEELRKYLHLFMPKDLYQEKANFFIPFFEKQKTQITQLKRNLNHIDSCFDLKTQIENAPFFKSHDLEGKLISLHLPIEDRKSLAQTADKIKSQITQPCIVLVLGEGKTDAFPLVITVSKNLQKTIFANEIFKTTVAPFLEGKGGGGARFASGVIKNKKLFPKLNSVLLTYLEKRKIF